MSPTPNTLLDLRDGVGQFAYSFQFDVLSSHLEPLGSIPVVAASITNDVSATYKRSMRGVTIKANDARHVNPYTDRLRVSMVLEDGSRWPCGVFMFTDDNVTMQASHRFLNATLVDQSLRLDVKIREPYGIPQNGSLQAAFVDFVERAGLFDHDIDFPAGARSGSPIGWATDTSLLAILVQIAQLAGACSPYFANNGTLRSHVLPPMTEDLAHVYNPNQHSRIVADSRTTSRNLLNAPNVYQVECSALSNAPIIAVAFVDARLPHSVERLGYERPKIVKLQGIVDSNHAQQIVTALALGDPVQLERSSFSSSPDPRHDTFDIYQVDGQLYRGASTELPIEPKGQMQHSLTKQLDPADSGGAL